MAIESVTAANGHTMLAGRLDGLGLAIQGEARRIESLSEAIDQALDFEIPDKAQREAISRALDYLALIREAATKARDDGERVEIEALGIKKSAGQSQ